MKVQTVTGEIKSDDLGITLPHEHLIFDLTCFFTISEESTRRYLAESPVSMSNLGQICRDPTACRDNLVNHNVELAIKELAHYKRAGGRSLVDVTNVGIARDPLALKAISIQTRVHIIAGCGYYIGASHPPRVNSMSVDEIAQEITNDIIKGIGGTGVKAGIIGEIGTSWPIEPNEEKVLRAAAMAHHKTHVTINIHPFCGSPLPWAKDAHKLLDIMEEEGVDLSKVVLSHMDATGFNNMEEHASLAKRGAYIEYDLFGSELYYDSVKSWDARDTERVQGVLWMIESGYLSQLLISHDICYKVHFKEYGGYGFDHILVNVLPMLLNRGVSQKQLDEIMVENPKKILAF